MATILLAEDDEAVRDMLDRALSGDGHTVIAVGDGQAALDATTEHQFDVLVSDISMPEPDGITLAEALIAQKPGLAVVLMSAIADELKRAQMLTGGKVRILSKPASLERVRSEVAGLLGT